jgi:GT2 family glycosyltransferase
MFFPKVGVVIPNWNGKEVTIDCISSISKSTYLNYSVIVIDNGSSDNSIDAILQMFPEVFIIRNITNLGLAEAYNQGIVFALENGVDYIFLLNNDTIVDQDTIKELVEVAENNPQVGVLCSKILYFTLPNVIWSIGAEFNLKTGYYKHLGYNQFDYGKFNKTQEVNYAPGCALLIPSFVFKKVGMWDPNFFMYAEDIDFCLRVRKENFHILLVPSSKVWHKVSFSSGGNLSPLVNYYSIRNTLYVLGQHAPLRNKMINGLRTFNVMMLNTFGIFRSIINQNQTVDQILNTDSPFLTRLYGIFRMIGVILISPLVLITHASELKPLQKATIRAVKDYQSGIRGKVDLEA